MHQTEHRSSFSVAKENCMAKTSCPIGRADFRAKAKPLSVVINDQKLSAPVKEFSTGSFGWYLNGKMTVEIDGVPVAVQIGLNMTVVGSKELPAEAGGGQTGEVA
jgi:hypothetical protein